MHLFVTRDRGLFGQGFLQIKFRRQKSPGGATRGYCPFLGIPTTKRETETQLFKLELIANSRPPRLDRVKWPNKCSHHINTYELSQDKINRAMFRSKSSEILKVIIVLTLNIKNRYVSYKVFFYLLSIDSRLWSCLE